VDIATPGYEYNVFQFQEDFRKALAKVKQNGMVPVLCGGTGLYIDAVISGYAMQKVPVNEELRAGLENLTQGQLVKRLKQLGELHNVTDISDRMRTIRAIEIREYEKMYHSEKKAGSGLSSVNFGIFFERKEIRNRITERLTSRLESGLVEEVAGLIDSGIEPGQLTFYGLEYRFVTQYIQGELTYDEMFEGLNTAIHQFAKRQMTWFRRMERKGIHIHWIDGNLSMDEKLRFIRPFVDQVVV
jgi:tRNA dimethylallyltransferase